MTETAFEMRCPHCHNVLWMLTKQAIAGSAPAGGANAWGPCPRCNPTGSGCTMGHDGCSGRRRMSYRDCIACAREVGSAGHIAKQHAQAQVGQPPMPPHPAETDDEPW